MKVVKTVHYCKGLKQTGKPVIVANKHGSKNVRKWVWKGKDEDGTPIRMEIEFGNSDKNAKKRGATTVLKVYK